MLVAIYIFFLFHAPTEQRYGEQEGGPVCEACKLEELPPPSFWCHICCMEATDNPKSPLGSTLVSRRSLFSVLLRVDRPGQRDLSPTIERPTVRPEVEVRDQADLFPSLPTAGPGQPSGEPPRSGFLPTAMKPGRFWVRVRVRGGEAILLTWEDERHELLRGGLAGSQSVHRTDSSLPPLPPGRSVTPTRGWWMPSCRLRRARPRPGRLVSQTVTLGTGRPRKLSRHKGIIILIYSHACGSGELHVQVL